MMWRASLTAALMMAAPSVVAEEVEADFYCHQFIDAREYAHDVSNPPSGCGSFIQEWDRTAVGTVKFLEKVLGTPYSIYSMRFDNGEGAIVLIPSDG